MITFLPSSDFAACASMLDDKRLGGQRTEAWAILKWLRSPGLYPKLVKAGYCKMWAGYEPALVRYLNAMLREWASRGKKNELLRPNDPKLGLAESEGGALEMPPWLGDERLHSCHRHALMAKLPEHYSQFGWEETGSEYRGSYMWPVLQDGEWYLRWPEALKLDPMPLSTKARPETRSGDKFTGKRQRATAKAQLSREELVTEYERLTKRILPQMAKEQKWPIRWDHCFQRIVLDNAFEGCWYSHLDRKKGPAIKQISIEALGRAVELAQQMEVDGVDIVLELDAHSLAWRGKKPKVRRIK